MTVLLMLGACGGGGEKSASEDSGAGEPPSRTIRVIMRDDFTYDPANLQVKEGERIEFVVVNEGGNRHELLIGDSSKQQEYEQDMRRGGHERHGDKVTGVNVEPGAEKSFVFTVPKAKGNLLFGCHEPGHYEAGMRGELVYSQSAPAAPRPEPAASPESGEHH